MSATPEQVLPLNADASPTKGSRRSIAVSIKDVVGLTKSTATDLERAEPQIHVGLGKVSTVSKVGMKVQGEAAYDFSHDRTMLPHNGEEYLRFMLTDGTYQVGFADVPIADALIGDHWEGPVALHGRGGIPCGTLRVIIDKTGERIQPNLVDNTSVITTNANNQGGAYELADTRAVSTDDESEVSQTVVTTKNVCRSVWVTIVDGSNLVDANKKHEFAQSPYVVAKLGKDKLRTKEVKASGDHVTFNQTLIFPYKQNKTMRLDVLDDKKMKIDPKVGSTLLDLEKYLVGGEQRVAIPLAHKGSPSGTLNAIIEMNDRVVDKAQCVPKAAGANIGRVANSAAVAGAPAMLDDTDSDSNSSHGQTKLGTNVQVVCRSIHLEQLRTSDTVAEKPFVKVRVNKSALRADDLQTDGTLNEHLVYPYRGEKHIKFTMQRDKRMKKDPVVGTGKLDMSPFVTHEVDEVVDVPCYNSAGQNTGVVTCRLRSSMQDVAKAHKVEAGTKAAAAELDESLLGVPPCKSFKLRPAECTNVKSGQNPYIISQFGKKHLRTKTYKEKDASGKVFLAEEFQYPYTPHRYLNLQLWDDINMGKDDQLGSAQLDLDDLLVKGPQEIRVPMGDHNVNFMLTPSNDELKKAVCAKAAQPVAGGMYKSVFIKVKFADNLTDPKPNKSDVIDPYCYFEHGSSKLQGKQHKNAGLSPIFMETYQLPAHPGQPIKLSVFDNETMAKDVLVGSGTLALPPLDQRFENTQYVVDLENGGKSTGRVFLEMNLLQDETKKPIFTASKEDFTGRDPLDLAFFEDTPLYPSVVTTAVAAQNLKVGKGKMDTADPYISLSNGTNSIKGKVHKNQGADPTFNESFIHPVDNHRFMRVNVYDDALGKDPLIGSGKIDLQQLVCEGYGDLQKIAVPLRDMKGAPAGEVLMEIAPSAEKVSAAATHAPAQSGQGYVKMAERSVNAQAIDLGHNPATAPVAQRSSVLDQTSQVDSLYQSIELEIVRISGLINPNPSDVLDPFIRVSFGPTVLSGDHHENAGGDCNLDDVFSFPYTPYQFMKIDVVDHNLIHKDDVVGTSKINLDSFVTLSTTQQKLKVPLLHPGTNAPAGTVFLKIRFFEDARVTKPNVEHISK